MTGSEFRTARKAIGYTSRVHIAEALNVSESTIQRWESTKGDLPRADSYAMNWLRWLVYVERLKVPGH